MPGRCEWFAAAVPRDESDHEPDHHDLLLPCARRQATARPIAPTARPPAPIPVEKFKRLLLVVLALSPLVGSYCLLDEAVQYGWEVGKRASATECGKGGKARPQLLKTALL